MLSVPGVEEPKCLDANDKRSEKSTAYALSAAIRPRRRPIVQITQPSIRDGQSAATSVRFGAVSVGYVGNCAAKMERKVIVGPAPTSARLIQSNGAVKEWKTICAPLTASLLAAFDIVGSAVRGAIGNLCAKKETCKLPMGF